MDELKVEYTVKEMFHLLGGKIDKLDEKVDKFMDGMGDRVTTLEVNAVARDQFEATAAKTKWTLYGLIITGAGVLGEAIAHFVGKK